MKAGQLGTLVFELVDAPETISQTWKFRYAEHEIASGLSDIEYVGSNRSDVTMHFRFRDFMSCPDSGVKQKRRPIDSMDFLLSMAEERKAHQLHIGNRYLGKFVITDIGTVYNSLDGSGAIDSIDVDVTLKEYSRPRKGQVGNEV